MLNSEQRGIVLLTTLLMLGLLAALMLSIERAFWLYAKLHQKVFQAHAVFYQLEEAASALGKKGPSAVSGFCVSDALDVNDALWHLQSKPGCRLVHAGAAYRYWFTQLKSDKTEWVLAMQANSALKGVLMLRFSSKKGLLSWRYFVGDG